MVKLHLLAHVLYQSTGFVGLKCLMFVGASLLGNVTNLSVISESDESRNSRSESSIKCRHGTGSGRPDDPGRRTQRNDRHNGRRKNGGVGNPTFGHPAVGSDGWRRATLFLGQRGTMCRQHRSSTSTEFGRNADVHHGIRRGLHSQRTLCNTTRSVVQQSLVDRLWQRGRGGVVSVGRHGGQQFANVSPGSINSFTCRNAAAGKWLPFFGERHADTRGNGRLSVWHGFLGRRGRTPNTDHVDCDRVECVWTLCQFAEHHTAARFRWIDRRLGC